MDLLWFLHKKDKQAVVIINAGNIASEADLEISQRCIVADNPGEAWVIDDANLIWNDRRQCYIQVVSEKSVEPIPLYTKERKEVTEQWLDSIAEVATDEAIYYEQARLMSRRAKMGWVGVAMLSIVIIMIVVLIVGLVQSGGKIA